MRLQHDPIDVGDVAEEAHSAKVSLLPSLDEYATARVAVGALQRLRDLPNGEPVLHEPLRPNENLVLLHLSPEAVHLIHAGDRLEEWRHDPVLDRAQVHRGKTLPVQRVLEDLAEAGRERAELRVDPAWQLLPHGGESLEDDLAGPVRVDTVLEDHDHLGQAGLGDGADLLHAWQAAQVLLDGKADAGLHVHGGEARGLRQDHDLGVGDVGEGVDGKVLPGHDAADGEGGRDEEDEEAVTEDPLDDSHVDGP